jgi:phage gpG-like protein
MFTITVTDASAIDAFNRLIAFGESPQPALKAIGEKMVDFTKQRFVDSADPYGNPWALNSPVTLQTVLQKTLNRSKKNFKKDGSLSAKAEKYKSGYLSGKKPLIGATRDLSTKFNPTVIGDNLVTVSSPMVYAATQQFGAKQGQFGRGKRNHPIPWGDIPARPFFPDPARGLPEPLQQSITEVLRIALRNAAGGGTV